MWCRWLGHAITFSQLPDDWCELRCGRCGTAIGRWRALPPPQTAEERARMRAEFKARMEDIFRWYREELDVLDAVADPQ